jgi:hypothetical protein
MWSHVLQNAFHICQAVAVLPCCALCRARAKRCSGCGCQPCVEDNRFAPLYDAEEVDGGWLVCSRYRTTLVPHMVFDGEWRVVRVSHNCSASYLHVLVGTSETRFSFASTVVHREKERGAVVTTAGWECCVGVGPWDAALRATRACDVLSCMSCMSCMWWLWCWSSHDMCFGAHCCVRGPILCVAACRPAAEVHLCAGRGSGAPPCGGRCVPNTVGGPHGVWPRACHPTGRHMGGVVRGGPACGEW